MPSMKGQGKDRHATAKQSAGLSSIDVQRFKSLESVKIDLGQVNVLIGANGSGKSNLLEAVGIIGAAAAGRVDDQALLRRGVRPGVPRIYKSAFPNATKDPSIRITTTSGTDSYFVGIVNQGKTPQPFWHFQHEKITDSGSTIASRSPKHGSATIHGQRIHDERSASLAVQARANLNTGERVRALLSALDDYAIFAPVTPVLRGIAPDTAPRSPVGLFGGGLPDAVEFLAADSKSDLRRAALDLISWAADFKVGPPSKQFIASSVPTMRKVVQFQDQFMRKSDRTISGYDASEGALYILYLFCLAMHPGSPRLFAVDNFDQALNPAVAREVARVFCRAVLEHERQVLITTHNPLVLDGLPLGDPRVRLFRVERAKNGRSRVLPVPVKDLEALKAKYGQHAISRMWIEGRIGGLPNVTPV